MSKGRTKEQLESKEEQDARAQYAKHAVGALNQAMVSGYRDMAHLVADADLDIIRPEDGYRAIIEQFGKSR